MSETPPAGYRKLPDGTRCRCIRLWQDGVGGFYCCRSSATLAFADSLSQHCPNCEAQAAEIEKLREALDRIYMEDRRVVDRWRQSLATGDSHLDTQIVLGRFAEIALAALGETK